MLTIPRRISAAVVAVLFAVLLASAATAQEAPRPADDRKLAESVAAFVRAFNSHDAAALARFWKPDAVHVAKATGARTTGRQAIQDAYAALFKDDSKCELHISVSQIRFVTPTVANLDCVADVRHTSGDVSRSELSVLLVQDGGGWLIDQVHETDVPIIPAATLHLNQLQWLVGNWVDETKDMRVMNETHWAGNNNFLVRTYQLEEHGAISREGTQVIGWDAEQKCLRCWLFDGSGSFGEGTWLPENNKKWVNKMVLKMADGRRGSLTQVYQLTGENKLTIETLDREIDGAAQPNGPAVTLVRPGSEPPAAATPAAVTAPAATVPPATRGNQR